MSQSCNVVEQGCQAPPVMAHSKAEAECFACGAPVCLNAKCSAMVKWYRHGEQRVCQRCREDAAADAARFKEPGALRASGGRGGSA